MRIGFNLGEKKFHATWNMQAKSKTVKDDPSDFTDEWGRLPEV